MIELKHNNVKFQIDFPILFFFFPFLLVFFFCCYFTPTVFDTLFLSQRLFFSYRGGRRLGYVGYDCILNLWKIKRYLKC